MLELNKIYNMDCIKGMKEIDNESIDLILADPPYNISMESRFNTMNRQGVDFGEWDKNFNQEEWLRLALDKVKKGGSVIIFNSWKNIGIMKDILEEKGFDLKELIQWKKTNPMPRNRDRLYVTTCEFAIWAVKGKGWTFNRQRDTYENTIFEYATVTNKERIHPTQKKEELIKDLLKIHSNKGDIILDPFMGSGTLAKCCIDLDRNFIGFEINKDYYDKSLIRLKKAYNNKHNYIKSPLNYVGGKYKLLNQIVPLFPKDINTFVDVFCGGFNVGININARNIIANDICKEIIDLYKDIQTNDPKYSLDKIKYYIDKFDLRTDNKDGYLNIRNYYNNENRDSYVFYAMLAHSFNYNIRFNNKGKYNVPFGRNKSFFNKTMESNFIEFSNAIKNKNIVFKNSDFRKLNLENLSENDFVYLDPPYLITNANYNKIWNEENEKELLNLLDKLNEKNIKFALSNVITHKDLNNNILIEWSKKYNIHYLDYNYNNCSYNLVRKKTNSTVEVLITNY